MSYTADLSGLSSLSSLYSTQTTTSKSSNTKAGESLNMDDYLKLMVAMFQYQDMENTASTTDMLNQMVQMSVVNAISEISTLINESTTMTYAASLVGKEVTIGQYDSFGNLSETVGTVTGTGTLNGEQVIFVGEETYKLTEVMAVGRLPEQT